MNFNNAPRRARLISADEVAAAAVPLMVPIRGIYFLLEYGEIVYVGQSQDCRARIQQHAREKEFDSYSIFQCPAHVDLDTMEAAHIAHYLPRDNRRLPTSSGYLGITEIRRMGLNKRHLARWTKAGLITPVYMGNGVYYRESEIQAAARADGL